jgi:2,3-bisphosphoglycerate-independent phosphoglycerate mutase
VQLCSPRHGKFLFSVPKTLTLTLTSPSFFFSFYIFLQVGHTGIYPAAIKGVEATDTAIGIIKKACDDNGYILFVTADHGNAEKMLAADGVTPHTAHTCNHVPFVMTSTKHKFIPNKVGVLADVAPTLLDVMGLPVPEEMGGQSLLSK